MNTKYILIIIVLAAVVGGGILAWKCLWVSKPELNLTTTKLATIPSEYDDVRDITFSPDGQRVAYIGERAGKEFIVIDSKESDAYDEIVYLDFSSDGKHFAYIVKEGEYFLKGEGSYFVVLDGKKGQSYDLIYTPRESSTIMGHLSMGTVAFPCFSSDNERFAYVAKRGKKTFTVIDGKEGKSYDNILSFSFSPNGERFAYIAIEREARNWIIVLDDKETIYPDYFAGPFLFFSPDSKHLAYVVEWSTAQKRAVIRDGEMVRVRGDNIFPHLVFSPNSEHLAYGASDYGASMDKDVNRLVLDGKEDPAYRKILEFSFSPDSKHFAYIAESQGKYLVVTNEQKTRSYDNTVGALTFSPDSKHLAYIKIKGATPNSMIIDGKEKIPVDTIFSPPVFTSDSKHVCYGAKIDNELWWIVDKVE